MSVVTQTITTPAELEDLTKDQFLSQDFELTKKLNEEAKKAVFKPQYVSRNVILFALLHIGAIVGLYQFFFLAKWQTMIWSNIFI